MAEEKNTWYELQLADAKLEAAKIAYNFASMQLEYIQIKQRMATLESQIPTQEKFVGEPFNNMAFDKIKRAVKWVVTGRDD